MPAVVSILATGCGGFADSTAADDSSAAADAASTIEQFNDVLVRREGTSVDVEAEEIDGA